MSNQAKGPNLPMIVVGPNDLEAKVRLFKLGADDYVVDPFDRTEFFARIKSWISQAADPPSVNPNELKIIGFLHPQERNVAVCLIRD